MALFCILRVFLILNKQTQPRRRDASLFSRV